MTLDVQVDGRVATITVNRPESLNALNSEILRALLDTFTRLGEQPAIRAVVLTGAGDRAFIAGADIAEMRDFNATGALEFSRLGHAVCNTIESFARPVIAAINGFALGGGCEIAIACDIRLASESARIGQPEVGLGIPPGWGATQRLPRIVGAGIAKEMIFSGRHIRSDEALRTGLVSAVYSQEDLLRESQSLASRIAAHGPNAVAASKRLINQSMETPAYTGKLLEMQAFALAFDSGEQTEGMSAFLDRRSPNFGDE